MAILLPQQITDIRAAIKQATDQFFVTPVAYYNIFTTSLDHFQEDRQDRIPTPLALKAMVEYPVGGFVEPTAAGGVVDADIKCSFNMDDLGTAGLLNANFQVPFNPANDYMDINGIRYYTVMMLYDGALEQKNVLLVIFAKKKEGKS